MESEIVARKLEALKKGENTDCVFQVGPDGQTKKFHACKFLLVASSEFFEGLLRSPLTPPGPIRIKHVQPKIFQMVLEYAHTGQIVTKVTNLEECVLLASVADEFLLLEIRHHCAAMLDNFITMQNVLTTFSEHHQKRYIFSACQKLMSSETENLLKDPNFFKMDLKALSKFLAFKEMNITSELVLIRFCLEYVKKRAEEEKRIIFRQYMLPHLRLLTLRKEDLADVSPFLDLEEKLYLIHYHNQKDPLLAHDELSDSAKLSPIREQRNLAFFARSEKQTGFNICQPLGHFGYSAAYVFHTPPPPSPPPMPNEDARLYRNPYRYRTPCKFKLQKD